MKSVKKNKGLFDLSQKTQNVFNQPGKISKQKADEEPLRNKILERAYFIWEEKGRPCNTELENWFQAEEEIIRKQNINRKK